MQGVIDGAAPFGVDALALLQECKADYGAKLGWFGESGGSCPPEPKSVVAALPVQEEFCTEAVLRPPLIQCILGASEACCGSLDAALAPSVEGSGNCLCWESTLQGVIDGAAPYGVDALALLQECKADFGAKLGWFGESGGSCPPEPKPVVTAVGVLPADPENQCSEAVLTPPLIQCILGASEACCGSLDAALAPSVEGSGNCLCLESTLQGVIDGAAPYGVDALALLQECKADFGAKLGWFGEPGGSCPLDTGSGSDYRTPSMAALAVEQSACRGPAKGECLRCVGGNCSGCTSCDEDSCAEDGFFQYSNACYDKQEFNNAEVHELPVRSPDWAKELLDSYEEAWINALPEKAKTYQHIDLTFAAHSSLDRFLEEASKGQWPLLAMGYGLVLLYVVLYFSLEVRRTHTGFPAVCFTDVAPGPVVSIISLLTILLATLATFGFCGMLTEISGLRFNPLTFQILPFLALGLGINDYFIIAEHLQAVVRESGEKMTPEEIISHTVSRAGSAVTMSSAANMCAFLLGAISRIPAVQDFAVAVAISVAFNYGLAIIVIPAFLKIDVCRAQSGREDPGLWLWRRTVLRLLCCGRCLAPPLQSPRQNSERSLWARVVTSHPFRVAVVCLFAGWMAVCGWAASNVTLGLYIHDVAQEGSDLEKYSKAIFEDYQSYPIGLYMEKKEGQDLGNPRNIAEARAAEVAFVRNALFADEEFAESSWITYYLDWTEGLLGSGALCYSDVEFIYDGFRDEADVCDNADPEERADGSTCAQTCASYPNQNPDPSSGERCQLSEDGLSCFCPWRAVKKVPAWDAFLHGNTYGQIAQTFLSLNGPPGANTTVPEASVTYVFYEGVRSFEDQTAAMRSGRKVLDNQEADMFAYDGQIYAMSEQYLWIRKDLIIAVGAAIGAAFVIMCPLIVHVMGAILVCFVLVALEVQLYGCLHLFNLRLNAVTLVNSIMAVGFGVEFCAHFTRCFMLASGSRNERMLTAYREISLPILSGGFTSFLSLLPIAFSQYSYFRVYFLGYYTLLIALALVSSLVFLPTFLALIGPPAYSPPPVEERKPGEDGDLENEPKTERQDPAARLRSLLHPTPPAPPSVRSEQSSLRVHTGYTSRLGLQN